MERFSQRESVLFGYSCPRVSFTNSNSPPKTPCRNSDFDFNDVFGGPPRRSSMQDKHFSFTESMDFYGNKEEDEALSCLVGEKPVFGEENMNRRRYTSDDFFDDIFRGDQSLSSTPRRRGKDPFSSAPGSRVLSPALPLPPKADPLGSSSLPPQFSLPAKLTKGVDSLVFGSSTGKPYKHKDGASNGIGFSSPSTSTPSRFSSQAIQTKEESGKNVQPPYHQSTLPPEISRSSEVSPDLISDEKDTKVDMEINSHSSEVRSDGSKFHFSIYKWASKGVPLAMPFRGGSRLRLKEPAKIERCSSAKGWLVGESEVKESHTQSFRMECNKQDRDSVREIRAQDRVEPCQNVAEAILLRPESENLSSLQSFAEDIPGSTILQVIRQEIKPPSLSLVDLCDQSEREIRVLTEEVYRPALKPVRSLFFDNDYEHGNDGTTEKGQGKETTAKSTTVDASKNVKKQDEKRPKVNDVLPNEASFQDSAVYSADKLGRNRVKGMVKEFVKIFNQEGSPQPKDDCTSRSENSNWKKRDTNRAESEVRISTIGVEEETPRAKADGYLKQTEKEHFAIKTTNNVVGGTLSGQKDYSSSSTTSVLHVSKAAVEDTDESFQGNFLIKELTQGKNEPSQSGDTQEIQVIDAKVRQWSNGKTGNIRSLLSTLQYVLWPESGWKPVPLVDIIEGTSVKRAYQKALLCLHPDKLQQKGAAWHQRYIAEIVFKILQEAWTHFNSLGSL